MDIQYSPNSFSSFNIYSLSSEWIHHPLWGKRWTHWHQGCSAREDSRHREISGHATSSCQKCWFCFSKYSTDHELSRRNTKEISKVPRKWFGIWKKNFRDTWMLPEHTFWMWSLGNYEPGSEKLSSAIQPKNFTWWPPLLGNCEVSRVSKSFMRRSLTNVYNSTHKTHKTKHRITLNDSLPM